MTRLRQFIARVVAGMADDGALMRELAALSRDHTSDHTHQQDEPRSDGV
jgi:hypothetical protein